MTFDQKRHKTFKWLDDNERVDVLERENDALRELVYDMAVRCQTLENVAGMAVLDARFYARMDVLGIEVER